MKTYLEIPFKDGPKARSLGARFDLSRKQWFCPDGVDLEVFKQWLNPELATWFDTVKPATKRSLFQNTGSPRRRAGQT